MRDLNFDNLYRATVIVFFLTLLGYIMVVAQGFIVPLLVAFFLSFLLIPFNMLLERIYFPRVLASLISVVLTIAFLAGLLTLFGSQIQNFASDFDSVIDKISNLRDRLPQSLADRYDNAMLLERGSKFLQANTGRIFMGFTGFLSSFTVVIIVPIYMAFILIYRDHLKEFLYLAFKKDPSEIYEPLSKQNKPLITRVRMVVQKYLTGVFYVMCILFVLYVILLSSLGIKHVVFFSALAALLNIIPWIGPTIASILPFLFALVTKDSLFYPIAVLTGSIIIQTVEGNFLTPKIVGHNVSLNPFITLVVLIIGGTVWGIIGMILFIPLTAIIKEVMSSVDKLQPYAFLLGNPIPRDNKQKLIDMIAANVEKVKRKKNKR